MIALLVGLPLAGAVLVGALRGRRGAQGGAAVGAMLLTLGLALWLLVAGAGELGWRWSARLGLRLALEGFAVPMAVLVPAIAAPILAYAAADREERAPGRLLALMLGFVGAMELLVLAADLLTLLVAWELVGAFSYLLIAHYWREPWRPTSARQAFLTTRFGDLGLYLAAGAAYAAGGSLDYAALPGLGGTALGVVAGGVLLAAAAKSAQLPFAPWLFSAMAGPTPVSALLHSATLVAAGAYALVRLAPVLMAVPWFAPAATGIGLATALAGGVVAALQTDAKKALAGSTSSQYGLMFLAVGAGSTAAAGAHLVTHAAFKSLLFLGAGVAIHAAGSGELGRMRLGRVLPAAAVLFGVGALALAAVPPLGGAWSKEEVVAAAFARSSTLGWAALASGMLSAFYAARLYLLAYGPGGAHDLHARPRRAELLGMGALAGYSLLLALLWLPGAEAVVEAGTAGRLPHGLAWGLAAALLAVAAAVGLAWLLWRRGRLLSLGLAPRAQAAIAAWLGVPAAARVLVAQPTLALARALARFDERVVDAGVRATAAVGRFFSRLFSRWGERGIEGVVWGLADATLAVASASGVADDRGVDGVVEGSARGIGRAGTLARRLQTGMAHHYYVIVAVGVLGAVALIVLWR